MNPLGTREAVQAHLDDRRRAASPYRRPTPNAAAAPLRFTTTIGIDRPVREVFAFLEDFTHVPLWNYWVRDVHQTTPGPVGPGTRYAQTRREDAQRFEITTHDPNRQMTVATLPGDRPAFVRTFRLRPTPAGTRLDDLWLLDTGHPPTLQRLAAARVRAGVATNLRHLKELLERGHTVLPDQRRTHLPSTSAAPVAARTIA